MTTRSLYLYEVVDVVDGRDVDTEPAQRRVGTGNQAGALVRHPLGVGVIHAMGEAVDEEARRRLGPAGQGHGAPAAGRHRHAEPDAAFGPEPVGDEKAKSGVFPEL